MNIEIRPDLEQFVRERVSHGYSANESQVVEDALLLLRDSQPFQGWSREQFEAFIEEGERDFEEGRYDEYTPQLIEQIKAEGRRILADEAARAAGR